MKFDFMKPFGSGAYFAEAMATVLTDKAEDWSECSSRLLLDTPEFLRSESDWATRGFDAIGFVFMTSW